VQFCGDDDMTDRSLATYMACTLFKRKLSLQKKTAQLLMDDSLDLNGFYSPHSKEAARRFLHINVIVLYLNFFFYIYIFI